MKFLFVLFFYLIVGGFGRMEIKKKDFVRNVKLKVDFFSNIGYVFGGGWIKVIRDYLWFYLL